MTIKSMRQVQREVNEWGYETFPNSTPLSCAKHLHEEAHELLGAITAPKLVKDQERIADEIADVMMLAMQVAGRLGLQADELIAAKMERNRVRSWEYDPDLGYSKHIEDLEDPEDTHREYIYDYDRSRTFEVTGRWRVTVATSPRGKTTITADRVPIDDPPYRDD